jgi:hypothetical protein
VPEGIAEAGSGGSSGSSVGDGLTASVGGLKA